MKKYAIYLVVLLMAGVGTACSSGGSEGGPDYSSPDYGKFVITHSRKSFEKIPVFTPANDITGTITWSDGKRSGNAVQFMSMRVLVRIRQPMTFGKPRRWRFPASENCVRLISHSFSCPNCA